MYRATLMRVVLTFVGLVVYVGMASPFCGEGEQRRKCVNRILAYAEGRGRSSLRPRI
jgi:hypothetical protein